MRNKQPQASRPELADLIACWQADLREEHGERTVYRYAGAVRSFCAWFEEVERRPLDLPHLTPIALVGYRSHLQRRKKPAATSTINTHVSALRSFGKWLHEAGHAEANPAARLKLVGRAPLPAPKALTDPQVNALLRAAAHTRHPQRDTAIVQLLLQTGIRVGEATALRLGDIQFSEKRGKLLVRAGKGNKERSVPLNGSARQALADYLAPLLDVPPTLKAVAGAWPQPRDEESQLPLWRSQKGQGGGQLSESAIGRMIDGIVETCAARGLVPQDTSAHTLRHTFASHYLDAHPGDLVGLAGLLGHSSLDTTRIYTQPTADEIAERLERLDLNAFGG